MLPAEATAGAPKSSNPWSPISWLFSALAFLALVVALVFIYKRLKTVLDISKDDKRMAAEVDTMTAIMKHKP